MKLAMLDIMYRVPSDESITSCTVTKDALEGKAEVVTNSNRIE